MGKRGDPVAIRVGRQFQFFLNVGRRTFAPQKNLNRHAWKIGD